MIQQGDRGNAVHFAGSSPKRPLTEAIVEFDVSIPDKVAACQALDARLSRSRLTATATAPQGPPAFRAAMPS